MDIERSLELASKATPGPWWSEPRDDGTHEVLCDPQFSSVADCYGCLDNCDEGKENAAFIADARENYPELLKRFKRLRELRAEMKTFRSALDAYAFIQLLSEHMDELDQLLSIDGKDGA
jgi:Fe-S oxidoreductase